MVENADERPRKKLKAIRKTGGRDSITGSSSSIQTLPVAGGPDALSLKRYELWKSGNLCDFSLICTDGVVIKATKLELAVWSDFFRTHLFGTPQKSQDEIEIAQTDSEILGTLIRSLYEKEITVTSLNAHMLLALADRLRIPPVLEVVERYLISQINHENAVEALLMAEKHSCKLLRQAAIPLTASNFDRIDPKQLTLLTADDMQELLASDQLSSTEEHTLFAIVKQWSKGQDHGYHSAEIEQQILRLVKEIRLEHIRPENLSQILDDTWLQQHPLVLSAVAKALITKKDMTSPSNRKNRVGQVVRFSDWSQKQVDAETASQGQTSRQPLYSPTFSLQLSSTEWMDAHVQVYPIGFAKHPDKIGIFLAGNHGKENQSNNQHKFRITAVNQHSHKDSITHDFKQPSSSTGGTLKFWGSQQFLSASMLDKGFLVDDTLTISIVPMPNDTASRLASPAPPQAKRTLSERESSV